MAGVWRGPTHPSHSHFTRSLLSAIDGREGGRLWVSVCAGCGGEREGRKTPLALRPLPVAEEIEKQSRVRGGGCRGDGSERGRGMGWGSVLGLRCQALPFTSPAADRHIGPKRIASDGSGKRVREGSLVSRSGPAAPTPSSSSNDPTQPPPHQFFHVASLLG